MERAMVKKMAEETKEKKTAKKRSTRILYGTYGKPNEGSLPEESSQKSRLKA